MTQERSSSNRVPGISDAVLLQDQRELGPMRLPDHRADDFIDHFNRTYESLGIRLAQITSAANEKIPGSVNATGDDVSS